MYRNYFKRFLDFVLSLAGLIVISPIFIVVWIWLTIANEGAGAFFFQERPGRDEKIFRVIKFKSMNDKKGADGKLLPDKDRLTKVGAFVRKTSLDEIPQLINVLKGDMSLVGPRPLLVQYLPYYTERENLRHTVRPGITGWAQVTHGYAGDADETRVKIEHDFYYIKHISFSLDILIVFKTIKTMLTGFGAR